MTIEYFLIGLIGAIFFYGGLMLLYWFIGWIFIDKYGNTNSHLKFILKWQKKWSLWFWDNEKKFLYIFPLPFFGIILKPYRNNYN